ncbi:MAG TPA: LysE family translocator [Thermoleophilaceae bacterium]|nr:LysE family translocator [Thermoleophilaceae bacterium]
MLPDSSHLALFVSTTVLLLIIPGPAVLYIVAQSVEHGRRAGLAAVGGIHVGSAVHVAAATVGLSALLVSSAVAFSAVKLVGAAYLIFLGVQRLIGRGEEGGSPNAAEPQLGRIFRQGIVVNVLNPKTALFFFAFLPQFVDPAHSAAPQIALLGLLWILVGLCTDGLYALLSGSVGAAVRRRPGFARVQRAVTGIVLIGLGVAAALTGRRTQHA